MMASFQSGRNEASTGWGGKVAEELLRNWRAAFFPW
jgi:hypothetical protein